MGRITIQEVAKVLTEKNKLEQRAANAFATELFAIIQERLQQGETVKVKGLGTFKIIGVEARESVSVRTGERVVIDGHSKVSFVPDTMMKELVNRPFSQFETVVLNDGIDFEDMKEETAEAAADDDENAVAEEASPVEEPAPMIPASEDVSEADEDVSEAADDVPEAVDDVPDADEDVTETDDEEEEPMPLLEIAEPEEKPWGKWLLMALVVVALMAASAFGGYYYRGLQQPQMLAPDTVFVTDTVFVNDTLSSVTEEVAEPIKEETSQKTDVPQKVEPTKKAEPKADPVSADVHDKYAEKDARVRLGAYRIVGTQQEVTVQQGQTFYGICRAYLGPDMECYVEVYNNLPPNAQVKAGQKIKIPKLQLKKRSKSK